MAGAGGKNDQGRLPFDPGRMSGPARPAQRPPTEREDALSVTQVTSLISRALADNLPRTIKVVGEISNLSARSHWYFQLKDEDSVVSCVMFASSASRVQFTPENGHEVLVSGRIEHYAKQGRTQLYVSTMKPLGAGALEQQFRALCEELRKLGWFAEERKRPLPLFPRRVAVVTSESSAALQDVLDTLRRRSPFVEILICDVRVQGDDAAPSIVRTLNSLTERRSELGIDTIILTRGGGSMEDLWAFNERVVAEAVIRSGIPIIAAIGHETDTTVAELCADLRAATPTQAAVRVAPDVDSLTEQLDHAASRLNAAIRRQLADNAQRIGAAARFWLFAQPSLLIERARQRVQSLDRALRAGADARRHKARARLDRAAVRLAELRPDAVTNARRVALVELEARLRHAMQDRIRRVDLEGRRASLQRAWRHRFDLQGRRIEALERSLRIAGPHSVLQRGFSVTLNQQGKVIQRAASVSTGDLLTTRLADGDILSIVARDDQGSASKKPARRRKTTRGDDTDAPSLFGD